MTITTKGDTTWLTGKTITVTDAMGDRFVVTMYDDHALVLTTGRADSTVIRNGPVVKLGPEALKAIAKLFQEGR